MQQINSFFQNLINKVTQADWSNLDIITTAVVIVVLVALIVSTLFKSSPTRKYFESVLKELKTTEWLKLETALKLTALVIVISALAIAIMTPLDTLFVELKQQYLIK